MTKHRAPRRPGWLAALAVAAGAAAASIVPGTAPAAAVQAGAGQLQVLSPRPGTVIVAPSAAAARALRLQASLETAGTVQGLAVRLNGHPVPGLRAAAGVQQVPLDAADGLAAGENLLWASAEVSGQARVVPVRFYAGYQAQGLLSVQLQPGGSAGPAATATIRVPAGGVDRLEASLNGALVKLPAAAGSGAPQVLDLAQLGAVHFGRNQLAVRLLMADGAVHAVTRTFILPGNRDIAVARLDGPATVGRTAVVDASRSLLPPGSGGLTAARWTLVSRPALSHARLGTSTGPQTTLRPDVPGRYQVGLRTGTGARAGADLLTVSATLPDLLVPLNTIAYSGAAPGVQIGPDFYPSDGQALQVLVLDRGTLGFIDNRGYPATPSDFAALGSYLQSLPGDDLVIVTHPGNQPALPSGTLAQLDTSLHAIGGAVAGQWVFGLGSVNASSCWSGATNYCLQSGADWQRAPSGGLYGGSFSVIGIPGMPAGQAWRETAAQNHTADGRITGYLTLGTVTTGGADQYTVVNGPHPYVPVDTCTAGACAVQVGNQAYPPAAGASGFHVVVLDRTTLQLIANSTVTTAPALLAAITNITSIPPVAHFLQPGTPFNDQRLVIIQSVGDGKLSGSPSSELLQYIDQLGGTPEYLTASITGAHAYALVGAATDLPWHATTSAESSTAMTDRTQGTPGQPTGHISGVLQRDPDGLYAPSAGDAVGPTNVDLYPIIYKPATAWPLAGDPGLTYVAGNIGLSGYPDVRSAYPNTGIDFASKAALLQGLTCTAGPDVCGPDFPALKTQLLTEFDWVQSARALAGDLRAPYVETASGPYFDVKEVTNEVLASIPVPPDSSATMKWLNIMTGVMTIGQNAARLAGQPEAAAVFGIAGAAGTIATQLTRQPGGGPAGSVTSTADQLSDQMYHQQTAYIEWVNQAEDILVSDYGKLSAVGTAVGSDPSWDWTSSTTNTVITALDAGTRAAAYSALLPIAWPGWNLKPGADLSGSNDVNSYICDEPNVYPQHTEPFVGALPQNQFHAAASFTPGTEADQVWLFADLGTWSVNGAPTTMPGGSLTDNIYGAASTGPEGAYQYQASWWRSTYNPPGHVTCQEGHDSMNVQVPWSLNYPPPDITPPLPSH